MTDEERLQKLWRSSPRGPFVKMLREFQQLARRQGTEKGAPNPTRMGEHAPDCPHANQLRVHLHEPLICWSRWMAKP